MWPGARVSGVQGQAHGLPATAQHISRGVLLSEPQSQSHLGVEERGARGREARLGRGARAPGPAAVCAGVGVQGRPGRKWNPLPLGAPRGSRWLGVYLLPHRLPAFYKYRFAPSRRLCAALRVVPDSTSVVSAPLSLRPSPAFPRQSLPPAWILPLLPLSSI